MIVLLLDNLVTLSLICGVAEKRQKSILVIVFLPVILSLFFTLGEVVAKRLQSANLMSHDSVLYRGHKAANPVRLFL